YPSYGDRPYVARKQTIASETYCVPLLWLALFRPADLVQRTFTEDGRALVAEAPLCARKRAIGQLNAAVPYLEELFFDCGPLDEFGARFRKALEPLRYRSLTIELEEIACMAHSGQEFYDPLRAALAGIGSDYSPGAGERFVSLAQFFKLRRFPP